MESCNSTRTPLVQLCSPSYSSSSDRSPNKNNKNISFARLVYTQTTVALTKGLEGAPFLLSMLLFVVAVIVVDAVVDVAVVPHAVSIAFYVFVRHVADDIFFRVATEDVYAHVGYLLVVSV